MELDSAKKKVFERAVENLVGGRTPDHDEKWTKVVEIFRFKYGKDRVENALSVLEEGRFRDFITGYIDSDYVDYYFDGLTLVSYRRGNKFNELLGVR